MQLAWHVAALVRKRGRLPRLESLLHKDRPKVRQTWQEQLAIVKEINRRFGGRPLKRKKAK